jgi:hypothetical protein
MLAVVLIGVVTGLSACTEDRRDAIRDGVGTVTITLPTRGDGTGGSPETTATLAQEPLPTTEAPTTEAPTTEAPPPETVAPETTTPATDADPDEVGDRSGLLVLALIAAAAMLIFLLGRRSSRSAVPDPAAPASDRPPWQDRARALYADARWLLDNTDRPFVATRSAAATGGAQAISADLEVRRRLDSLLTALYEAEADAPSGSIRQTLRELGASARALDGATQAAASAPPVETGVPSPEWGTWVEARRRLETALDRLADELRTA